MNISEKIDKLLLIAMAVVLPWQTKLIILPSPSPYLEVSLYGFQLISLGYVAWRLFHGGFKEVLSNKNRFRWLYIGLACLDVAVLVSVFPAFDLLSFLYHSLSLLLAEAVFVLIISRSFSSHVPIVSYFLAGLIPGSILGICQFLFQASFANSYLGLALHDPQIAGTSVIEAGIRWLRAYGTFDHPNIFGGVNAIAAAMSVILIARRKKRYFYIPFFLFSLATILSFSRAAIASLALFIAAFLLENLLAGGRYRKSFRPVILIVTPALFIFLLSVFPIISARVSGNSRLENISTIERKELLNQGEIIISKNAVIGVGLGNYILNIPGYDANSHFPWQYQPVHNAFLLVWAEIGVFGAVLLLAIFAIASIYLYKKKALSLLAPWLLVMSFDHWFWSLPFGIYFCFIFWSLILRDDFGTI